MGHACSIDVILFHLHLTVYAKAYVIAFFEYIYIIVTCECFGFSCDSQQMLLLLVLNNNFHAFYTFVNAKVVSFDQLQMNNMWLIDTLCVARKERRAHHALTIYLSLSPVRSLLLLLLLSH